MEELTELYQEIANENFINGFKEYLMTEYIKPWMIAVFIAMLVLLFVVDYIFNSYPIYCMAKNSDYKHPWLAWIPIAREHTVCMLGLDDYVLFGIWKFPSRAWGLGAFWVLKYGKMIISLCLRLLSYIPTIGWIFKLLRGFISIITYPFISILRWRFYYDVYRTYGCKNSDAMVWSILTVLVPLVGGIVLWAFRNRQPVDIRNKKADGVDEA